MSTMKFVNRNGKTLMLNKIRFGAVEMVEDGKRIATIPPWSAFAMRFDLIRQGWLEC